jgi:hypothetical protein
MRLLKNFSDWKIERDLYISYKPLNYDKTTFSNDALYETNNEEYGFYFYSKEEFGLCKFRCKLKILKDKLNPVIIYDSKEIIFHCFVSFKENSFEPDWTDHGLLVLRQVGSNEYRAPVIIINLERLEFVLFDKFFVELTLHDNNSITIVETFVNKEREFDRKETNEYNLNELSWNPLSSLTQPKQ